MPLFVSDEDFSRHGNDAVWVADKADAYIRDLQRELETVKAQNDAATITAEQTCSLLEQKYLSISEEFSKLESQYAQLQSSLDSRLSEVAELQSQKHQLHLQSIGKDGEIERIKAEVSELHKSKRQLIELVEQKDLEISEKNATIKSYIDRIVLTSDNAAQREARLSEAEAELARTKAACTRLSQEKELIERHNVWLNDELTEKVDSLIRLRRTHADVEADLSSKLADVERQFNDCSSSLKWNKQRVSELEAKLTSLQEELHSSKDAAAANEDRLTAELSTLNKLVELYKESSEEWSKKAGELEGVIKALETHLNQVKNDYKEKLERVESARNQFEKEAADLKAKLEKCEAEIEASRKSNELNLLPLSSFSTEAWMNSFESPDIIEADRVVVPKIPAGVSGTALAASLLRDGWSLAKMYAKYQEAVDAFRHEQLGRKESEAVLQRVLFELEEKAEVILDERVEHERMVEAYSMINQKLQNSISEQAYLEKTIQDLKAEVRKHERDYTFARKEIADLQREVTILLKECRDIQLRGISSGHDSHDYGTVAAIEMNTESDAERVITEHLLTFKDINGLVDQNMQLRSLVRNLSDRLENREMEFKENFEMEIKKHNDEAASRVAAVLQRAEEQGRMIESLHASVAMYKRLYEEEHKLYSSGPRIEEAAPERRSDVKLLLESSQEATRKAQDQAAERVKCLEEDLAKTRSEIISLRSERDKLALEANFSRERLESFMKEFEHQRNETNGVLARNIEFSQLIVDYQRKLRESSESVQTAEERTRKLTMEVSVLKHEKEMLEHAEKRACDEVRCLTERVHRLQASLDTIQSAEEIREEARAAERRRQEEYTKQIEREWADVKKDLQEERNNARTLTLDREQSIQNAMRQVEEMGKELANALHAVASAETRAAVAEAKLTDLDRRSKSSDVKVVDVDGGSVSSSLTSDEALVALRAAKEEIEKLREEVQANKDHMLQYKSIAQVNEDALRQMESAHENFKIEAEKLKKSLETELLSLRERVSELEHECSLKSQEVASAAAGKEEALSSTLSEIISLKEETSTKISQIVSLEIQISALKEDLEKEHQRWRSAQANYERQVILQSETIQELTKTSQALATLQEEASELRKLADALKSENNELKSKWEFDKGMLEESKNVAEKKYNEINEQNKILHSQLEALHIQMTERDRGSVGTSASTAPDTSGDAGLQNVISYLRRTKEIAETEISLLKQEKLRLQSQLESALKASETAKSSLHAERTNSRSLFTEEEMKSLQLQVREINLLRESNIQLREENKHNFEECQKLREISQKANAETENLERLLQERQIELEACKKEIEMQKSEKEHSEQRVRELLERYRNIDVQDYERTKEDVRQLQKKLEEKDSQIVEVKKLLSEKLETVSRLERDIANSRLELTEMEKRMSDALQVEASLKSDIEKQRKMTAQYKRRLEMFSREKETLSKEKETLSKEKEELSKENQALSRQLEELKLAKRASGDTTGEQAIREEKDQKIQLLEKHLERQREELRKEKDENRMEKAMRKKMEKAVKDSYTNVDQDKTKFMNELEKHKQALKQLSDELEKLKHAKDSLPEGTSIVQLLSGTILDGLAAAYSLAVENFEKTAHSVHNEFGAHGVLANTPPVADTSLVATSGTAQAPTVVPSMSPAKGLVSKATEESAKRITLPKTNVETRKPGRRLVRPRLIRPEEPQGDVEMSEMEGTRNGGKQAPSNEMEVQGNATLTQPLLRKRLASSSTSESREESNNQGEICPDVAAPVSKKSKGSDSPQGSEGQPSTISENLGSIPVKDEPLDVAVDLPQGSNEEAAVDAEKEETETAGEKVEEPNERQFDGSSQVESQPEKDSDLVENVDGKDMPSHDGAKDQVELEQQSSDFGGDREEGELVPDISELEGGGDTMASPEIGEVQPEPVTTPEASPARGDDYGVAAGSVVDISEVNYPEILNDDIDATEETADGSDKSIDGNDQTAMETDQAAEATSVIVDTTSTGTTSEVSVSKQTSPSLAAEEVRQVSPVTNPSTTINITERAVANARRRQQARGLSTSPSPGRGGPAGRQGGRPGRAPPGRGRGRGRSRGSTSGDQG
ncbi:nuclear-pore anchor-like isoform X2 [Malus sylvestris]|uniref:nuclear-pore anchor-like isoform X2 n=1 Tax=Malus sylvestris TaxID=3752 RepID=UPI0021AD2832|nr:nuclear-pore anchor-like isoform X2 [Malus sylvestris]